MSSKLTFSNLKFLIDDMKKHNVDKDHFSFTFKYKFDVIASISTNGYELLIGIHSINYGFLIKINHNFIAELKDTDYFCLCEHLDLTYRNNGFTSNVFLKLLSSKIPTSYSGYKHCYKYMIPFIVTLGAINYH